MERVTAILMHNKEMENVMRYWADIETMDHSPVVQLYAQSLLAFTRAHFTWAMHAHRCHSKHAITISKIPSRVAQSIVVEGLRFKGMVIRTRRSLRQLAVGPMSQAKKTDLSFTTKSGQKCQLPSMSEVSDRRRARGVTNLEGARRLS